MAESSYLQSNFQGGAWSQTYQGRMDDPHYRTALAVCINGQPTEQGAWTRCGGTQFLGTTRGGKPGRVMSFDINETDPYMLEFTDGFLRAWQGSELVMTASLQGVVGLAVIAISSANPAVVQSTRSPASGTSIMFSGLGVNNPLLQNRVFLTTHVNGTHFSLQDPITGANIDGSTLGAFVSGSYSRVMEIATSYTSGSWASLRKVQAETQAVLLNGTAPQVLTLVTPPGPQLFATFSLANVSFIDGPYLDPFNGSQATYDVLTGNVTLTFSFQAWSATVSYSNGDFVVSGGQGYKSLQDANLNHIPPNASFWTLVNGGAPVSPSGFTSGDIGRHIRLFSQPPLWTSGATYAINAVITYNLGYWQSLANGNVGIVPGTDATKWTPVTGVNYALWTWGRIISISGAGLVSVGAEIGTMGGVAQAFNGTASQASVNCASGSSGAVATAPTWIDETGYAAGTAVFYAPNGYLYTCGATFTVWAAGVHYNKGDVVEYQGFYYQLLSSGTSLSSAPPSTSPLGYGALGGANPTNANVWTLGSQAPAATFDLYAGADLHAATKKVTSVTIFPSNDLGFGCPDNSFTFNLWAKTSLPANATDGTLLGTLSSITQFGGAVSIASNDQATLWSYVWVEMVVNIPAPLPDDGSHFYTQTGYISQIEIFTPNVANGSVVTIQLAGPPLLYAAGTIIYTWRAGLYADTAGWPTCGCYHEGRLWLSGAVKNRLDSSNSNALFNMAPTGEDGTVADSNAISYTFNADSVNAIFWMASDAQGIICGTEGGEWLVQATTQGLPLTPADIQAHRVTEAQCANIEPARTEHTLAVVQRRKRKIIEHFADIYSGKFTAPNLMDKARNLTASGIEEVRYQREITPTIWARCGDGSLIGGVYRRDTLMTSQGPTFMGWFQRKLGSGRVVESIAVGPSQGGTLDALTMVTNDPATNIRHVEMMADIFEETDDYQNAWLLDDAVIPASYTVGATSLTINGLSHLNGETVTVFAAGLDCGDFAVAAGAVTVPFGDGISAGTGGGLFTEAFVTSFPSLAMPLVVGFTYTSDGQLLRPVSPAESGARAGPGFGKKRRNHYYVLQVVQTGGMSIGTDFTKLDPVAFKSDTQTSYPLPQLYTGVHRDQIRDDYSFDGQICWRITRPVPALVAAVGGMIMTQDA